MCGISGFVDYSDQFGNSELKAMNASLSHRGPDGSDERVWVNSRYKLGLAHSRLSIIDLSSAGAQPMVDDESGLALTFNGEIYNYQQIRQELQREGVQFLTHSDTEVLLKSWRQWGEKSLGRLNGMFSFALFDPGKQEFYLVRDRAGVKPLYYYFKDRTLVFGSEMKVFKSLESLNLSLSSESARQFVRFGYFPEPWTVYNEVKKLKAGHLLKLNLSSGEDSTKEYWNLSQIAFSATGKNASIDLQKRVEELMIDSFKQRMVSDVPVGMFLSGGYDSSTVAAVLQKHTNRTLKTFTIGFEEAKYDESIHARKVADYLETEHTEHICTLEDAKNVIPELPNIMDEPFGDSSTIPTYLVSKMAREHVKVSLSADGGDELFGGYGKYASVLRYMNKVPKSRALAAVARVSSNAGFSWKGMPNIHRRLERMAKVASKGGDPAMILELLSGVLTESELNSLVPESKGNSATNFELFKGAWKDLGMNSVLFTDFKTYMLDDILTKVDRTTMSVGLEGREPMLDYRLIEFLAGVPFELKSMDNSPKGLLRNISHKYLPREIMERPKMGFAVPVQEWMKKDLKDLLLAVLSREVVDGIGVFDWTAVKRLRENYLTGKNEDFLPVWFLFVYHQWCLSNN